MLTSSQSCRSVNHRSANVGPNIQATRRGRRVEAAEGTSGRSSAPGLATSTTKRPPMRTTSASARLAA
eukprot:11205653-Lingulodinium_polyedra.AAC.1